MVCHVRESDAGPLVAFAGLDVKVDGIALRNVLPKNEKKNQRKIWYNIDNEKNLNLMKSVCVARHRLID